MEHAKVVRPRVTIAALLVVVLGSALAFGAIRSRSPLWASACFTALVGSLGVALVVALRGREPRRSFALGYVVLGSLYWLVGFGLGFSTEGRKMLVTTQLLDAVYPKISAAMPGTPDPTPARPPPRPGTTVSSVSFTTPLSFTSSYTLNGTRAGSGTTSRVFTIIPATTLEDSERFQTIGHAILAILVALGGGYGAVLLFKRAHREDAVAEPAAAERFETDAR
jgi:hypothetical protein